MSSVELTKGEFNGMACRWLSNDQVRLAVTTEQGPRIVFWGWRDGTNLFAELPDAVVDSPVGTLHLLGGHRLWYAPEVFDRTYWPDNDPVAVTPIEGGALFTAPIDGVGVVKAIAVRMSASGPEVAVTHTLLNGGRWPIQLAPWAISMCRLGGVALLPQPQERVDPHGFLPNRRFSLWPYSYVTDPRLLLRNRITLIKATPGPNNKIGYRNVHGWFAYWLDGTFFTKYFDPQLQGEHPDHGCNAEFFISQDTIELESLAPLVHLEPGREITHEETWRLHAGASPPTTEVDALALATALGMPI